MNGSHPDGPMNDFPQGCELFNRLGPDRPGAHDLSPEVKQLLLDHEPAVHRIANELLAQGSLTGGRVKELLRELESCSGDCGGRFMKYDATHEEGYPSELSEERIREHIRTFSANLAATSKTNDAGPVMRFAPLIDLGLAELERRAEQREREAWARERQLAEAERGEIFIERAQAQHERFEAQREHEEELKHLRAATSLARRSLWVAILALLVSLSLSLFDVRAGLRWEDKETTALASIRTGLDSLDVHLGRLGTSKTIRRR